MKPVEMWVFAINNHSKLHGLLYEPFSGSGTTIIAAEKTCRRCYAMELSPQYVDVAIRRWQDFTGKKAVHAETGEAFPG
jgi:DNA modification methylase